MNNDQVFSLKLEQLTTEQRDPTLASMDLLSVGERCALQNQMDHAVAVAVRAELPSIVAAVEAIVATLRAGGRLIYVGAGSSGRLGVLDASECPPTFGTAPDMVQGVIAGGDYALTHAVEGVEDDAVAGAVSMTERAVDGSDCVVGITASGRTPFVLGALQRAKALGASTVGVTNNRPSEIEAVAQTTIAVVVGPEFVAGSTRLKSGTAQKLVLNMLTTQVMIEIGKTYGDAMVDVMATNEKLIARARRLVREITGAREAQVVEALDAAGGSAKLAILMLMRGVDASKGRALLDDAGGKLRAALVQ